MSTERAARPPLCTTALLDAIRQAHELYLTKGEAAPVFRFLLDALVSLTGSEYGFLDEVLKDENGETYKLSLALSDISWDEDSRRLYQELSARRLEFRNLDNLAGLPATRGELVISNDVPGHPHYRGTPAGHPPLLRYMGMPLYFGGELVGVAGLANRPEGYDETMAQELAPFLSTCASLIHAMRQKQREIWHLHEIEEAEEMLAAILGASSESSFLIDTEGVVLNGNPTFAGRLGYSPSDLIGKNIFDYLPEDVRDFRRQKVREVVTTGKPVQFEDIRNGRVFTHRVFPIRDRQERVTRLAIFGADITEFRQSEAALREREAQYRSLVENLSDIVWTYDLGRACFNFASAATLKILGYAPEEADGFTLDHLFDPTTKEHVLAAFSRLRNPETTENQITIEVPHRRRDGAYVWLEIRGSLLRDSDGNPVSITGVSRDVTERRTVQARLVESELRFRTLAELAPVGIVLSDREERALYVSPKFVEMFGYTQEEVTSVHDWFLLAYPDPATRERVAREWTQAIDLARRTNREIPPMEYPVTCKDGRVRDIEFRMASTGELNIVVFADITENRNAEKELREKEATMRSIFRAAPIGIGVTLNRVLLQVNAQVCAMLGYQAEELVGQSARMLYPSEEDYTYVGEEKYRQIQKKGYGTVETRWKRKDGSIIDVVLSSSPIDRDNPSKGVTFTALDITETKRTEEELRNRNAELQQAMKMEAVGRLAGGIAHDFNNLLTGVTGNVQLALMSLPPHDPIREMLDDVSEAAESATRLTRQLLAFSRKQIIEPRVLNLNELVANLHRMLRRLIGEDIELRIVRDERLGSVKIDPGQFEQILANLAVNARDAMPDGGMLIIETANVELDDRYCRLHPHTSPGSYVMLSVSDTGCGMSAEVKEHLFEPFFTTKPRGRGTGLGLATIYGAVKQLGGTIDVDSEVDQGTILKIYLPRVATPAQPLGSRKPALAMPGGTETVLLAEDEPVVRTLAIKILERLGYKTLSAANGKEALTLAQEYTQPIDLLMTDVVMPGMNGRELAERLLAIHPEMKVLFCSGYTEDVIANRGILEEGLNFIGKPYTPQELAVRLRKILD